MDPEKTDLTVKSKEILPQVKLERAVKAYKRSAADVTLNDPLTVRPLPIIEHVLDYLFEDIADADSTYKGSKNIFASEPTIGDVFIFIFDRTRAIRQELTIINDPTHRITIQAYEKIARFHCLTANEGLDVEGVNHKLNSDQLTSTLTSLRDCYDLVNETLNNAQLEGKEIQSDDKVYQSPKEAEFRAYMIMAQIKDLLEVNEMIKTLPVNVLKSECVQFAMKMAIAYENKEAYLYFRLLKKAPYLISCCWFFSIIEMRKIALDLIRHSFMRILPSEDGTKMKGSFGIKLDYIWDILSFNDVEEAKDFLPTAGYKIETDKNGDKQVVKSIEQQQSWKKITNHRFIESKKIDGKYIQSRADIIRGNKLEIKEEKKLVKRFEEPKIEIEPSSPKFLKPIFQPEKPNLDDIKKREEKKRLEIQEELSK